MDDRPQKQARIKHTDEPLAVVYYWIVCLYIQPMNISKQYDIVCP